jgi:hypothetical protein
MNNFPSIIDTVLQKIADEFKLRLARNTHYEATNRELRWFEKNVQKRTNFTFDGKIVTVTFYKDTFPFSPRFLLWCHNNIPMFGYFARTEWQTMESLPADRNENFYSLKLRALIEQVSERK